MLVVHYNHTNLSQDKQIWLRPCFDCLCNILPSCCHSNDHVFYLFVPKTQTWEDLAKCYKAAYAWGYDWVDKEYCTGYNIGQNIGSDAGQTIMWPHVHLIPRRKGDMEDPKGGVRHVIPSKGNYTKDSYFLPTTTKNDLLQMELFDQ